MQPRQPRGSRAEIDRAYRERNPESYRRKSQRAYYKKRYGMTYEEKVTMHNVRNGLCDICGMPNKNGELLFVDHNHKTGKVRGMLCIDCNMGIGRMKDSPELLRVAAAYLDRSS